MIYIRSLVLQTKTLRKKKIKNFQLLSDKKFAVPK